MTTTSNWAVTTSPGKRGATDVQVSNYNTQGIWFLTQNYRACKEAKKYVPFTGKINKSITRNGPWQRTDILRLTQQALNELS